MIPDSLRKAVAFVTDHSRITLLVMVLLSAGMVAGIPQLETGSQVGGDADTFDHLDRVQKYQYIQDNYATSDDNQNRTLQSVYVRNDDGDVLTQESLLAGLRYQQTIRGDPSVQPALHTDGVTGLENLVAKRAAGDPNATLDEQISALDDASPERVKQLVGQVLTENPEALRFLPADHDPQRTTASDRRILVALDTSVDDQRLDNASETLYNTAKDRSEAGFFVLNNEAWNDYRNHFSGQMIELVLPVALLFILVVLAFAYRDLVDVVVGMTGVTLSVLWMFGLLGWLGVAAGLVSIVPVVLVSGLSIDFGFHVFNRYREQRGDGEGIRAPMRRGVVLVATALVLVTVTAAIGFLSNLANPLALIRNLGISITLGVVSALLIFVTVVPALKIEIDGALERWVGLDRRKQALGHGRYLKPLLERSVTLARRGAPVVLVLAVVVGTLGGAAWMDLDEESFQQGDGEVAEWKQELPGPLGWEPHPVAEQNVHVQDVYQPASADDAFQERILIEGDVTSDSTLADLQDGVDDIEQQGLLIDQPGTQVVESPVTAMQALAADNETFAAAFEASDPENGVPQTNLEELYDAFYAADSDAASRVIEQTDDGKYRSLLVTLSLDASYSDTDGTVEDLTAAATVMVGDGQRTATVAGGFAVNEAILNEIVSGILTTMAIALAAIVLTLAAVFRYMHGSATLGLAVAVPIVLVLGIVIGGMYVLSIPLTLLTALLMSLVIGLGVDYNIHIGDRFADERREGKTVSEALSAAVTGTGGALLGSTITSAGAFATIMLVPDPQLQSFGAIVVVALTTSFVVSVLVLPSLLVLWDRYVPTRVRTADRNAGIPQD